MPSDLSALLLPVLLLALVGFMFWSQRRRQRAVTDLQEALQVGDEVCTTSGLFGTITALDDTAAHLEVAPGVVVRFDRRAVAITVGGPSASGPGATADLHDAPGDPRVQPSHPTSTPEEK